MQNKKQLLNWKLIVSLLTFGWVTIWVYRTSLTPIYPQISAFFGGISDLKLGIISSIYFFGYAMMQIPSGLLIDKLGQRKVLFPGFTLFAIGALTVAFAPNINLVYFGSFIAGIGCGFYYGVAYSLTAIYVPLEKRSLATAIVNSGSALGSGIGVMFSTVFIANMGLRWQNAMFLAVGLILISLFFFNRYIIDIDKSESKTQEHNKKELLKTLFSSKFISVYILYFTTCFTYYLVDTWLPNFLTTERALSQSLTGLVTTIVFFSALPGAILFSYFADKFPKQKVSIILGLELIAGAILFLGIASSNQTVMIVCLILYGFFGKLAVEPIIISWLSEHIPMGAVATALGLFNFFGMGSSVVAPSVAGFISDVFNTKVPAFNLAIVMAMVSAVFFFIKNRKQNI